MSLVSKPRWNPTLAQKARKDGAPRDDTRYSEESLPPELVGEMPRRVCGHVSERVPSDERRDIVGLLMRECHATT